MTISRKCLPELRERAVRMVEQSGRPIAHVARDLGIHREALRLWVRQAQPDATPASRASCPVTCSKSSSGCARRRSRSCRRRSDNGHAGKREGDRADIVAPTP
ncbi:MAG: transposase [Gaiellaceae bacterium]